MFDLAQHEIEHDLLGLEQRIEAIINASISSIPMGNAGGGTKIGNTVIGGIPNSVLYIDAGGNLAQDNPNFTYDDITNEHIVNGVMLVGSTTFQTAVASVDLEVSNDFFVGGRTALGGVFDIDPDVTVVAGDIVTHISGFKRGMRFSQTLDPSADQDATAFTIAMSFQSVSSVLSTNDINAIEGFEGFAIHEGSGDVANLVGGAIVSENKGSGTVSVSTGLSTLVKQSDATGSTFFGRGLALASPIATGGFTFQIGMHMLNQGGSANITNAIGLLMEEPTLATSLNVAMIIEGGEIQLNTNQSANGDLQLAGVNTEKLIFADSSAESVEIQDRDIIRYTFLSAVT